MPFTVFYAWQSDTDPQTNHYLIREAAQQAIDTLLADLRIEEAPALAPDQPVASDPGTEQATRPEIELDYDTKDEPGTPNIAETIFRKIRDCGVFIADLTCVGHAQTADGRLKRLPNSNVLIELGQAAASVGWRQIILVMNTWFGDVEFLPFDLKNYSFPVRYALAPGADPQTREAQQKRLADELKAKLGLMQKHGVWSRGEEERRRQRLEQERAEAAALKDREKAAQAERTGYEERLAANTYRTFRAEAGLISITVIPLTPRPPRVPIQYEFRHSLAPIDCDIGILKHDMKSVLCYWPTEDKPLSAITELTAAGSIYAVWNVLYLYSVISGPRPIRFGFHTYEHRVVDAAWRYLGCLKALAVPGPWFVGFSLLKVRNFQLSDGDAPMHDALIRDADHIQTDLVMVPDELDLSKPVALEPLMLQPFRQVWRAFGKPGRPLYRADGSWGGFDSGPL